MSATLQNDRSRESQTIALAQELRKMHFATSTRWERRGRAAAKTHPGRRDGGHVRGGWGRRRSGGRRSGSGGVVLKDHAERDQAGHGRGNSAGVDHLDSGGTGAQRTGARRHI